jgi:hypothetical protein
MNQQERNYLKKLKKRMEHLEQRIAQSDKRVLYHDETERAALK